MSENREIEVHYTIYTDGGCPYPVSEGFMDFFGGASYIHVGLMNDQELLDLGEAVGTQSRGLSQEVIDLIPTSKHKSGGIFSRRKSGDRCVICQMRYKRGDRQINLPCKHAYHADCGSKWLSINKTCPVCNTEVVGDELRH